jgi:hypothetical protein
MPCKKNPGNGVADELLLLYRQVGFDPDNPIDIMREMGYEPPQVRAAIETLKEEGRLEPIELQWLESALNLKTDVLVVNPECEENPSQADTAVTRFWDGKKDYKSPVVERMGSGGDRGRRDVVSHEDYGATSIYYLWGHEIAQLQRNESGRWTLFVTDAGWPTQTTRGRLNWILGEGKTRYPDLVRYGHFYGEKGHTVLSMKDGKVISLADGTGVTIRFRGEKWQDPTKEVVGPIGPQNKALYEVQEEIDAIEERLMAYRREHPGGPKDMMEIARKVGVHKEYDKLLRKRFRLEQKVRGNPSVQRMPGQKENRVMVLCPVTCCHTTMCPTCLLNGGIKEKHVECKAKRGERYFLISHGSPPVACYTNWDAYVVDPKDIADRTGIRFIQITSKGGD